MDYPRVTPLRHLLADWLLGLSPVAVIEFSTTAGLFLFDEEIS